MRKELFYVDIAHITNIKELEFFGYHVLIESEEFWLLQCWDGSEHVVQKSKPFLLVDDVNDAEQIKAFQGFVFTRL